MIVEILHTETIIEGGYSTYPFETELPTKEGYEFVGWRLNDTDTIYLPPFDETNNPFGPINSDTDFSTVWQKLQPGEDVYTFSYNGVTEINVNSDGETLSIYPILSKVSTTNGETIYTDLVFETNPNVSWIHDFSVATQQGNNYITVNAIVDALANNTEDRNATLIIRQRDSNNSIQLTILQQSQNVENDYCEPITEDTTGQTTLNLKMFVVDTGGHVYLNRNFSGDLPFSGCGSAFLYFEKNNTGGINVSGDEINYSLIDDYGAFFINSKNFGDWPGGYAGGQFYNGRVTFSCIKDSSVSSYINPQGYVDEDNHILINGDMTNKALRIPCSGFNGIARFTQYPYNFESTLFYTTPKITYIKKEDNNLTFIPIENDIFTVNGFNGSLEETESSLDYALTYNITENDTCDYKHHMIYISNVNFITSGGFDENSVMYHFIQEYKVKNRIYYGLGFNQVLRFDDNFYETSSSNYRYHSWFETCSSKILMNDEEPFTDYGMLAYPNSEDFEYEFVHSDRFVILDENYMWGNQSFTIFQKNMVDFDNNDKFIKK